jgi:hypothetical protein
MTRITPEHLARDAFIYVRQSTNDQVIDRYAFGSRPREAKSGTRNFAAILVVEPSRGIPFRPIAVLIFHA